MTDSEHQSAFMELLTSHQGNIRAFVISLLPGSPEAGDVVQETNLVLWNKRKEFEIGTNFTAWAFTIARYQVLKSRSKIARDSRFTCSDELMEKLTDMQETSAPENDYLHALENCLGNLKPTERKLITARYSPGMSLSGLAKSEGKSAGRLRIALMRLRVALRRCVEDQITVE